MITYDYEIEHLGVHKNLYNHQNVVYEIRGYLIGTLKVVTENTVQESTIKKYFVANVPILGEIPNFIEFDDLTKDTIIGWVEKYSFPIIEGLRKEFVEDFYPTKVYLTPSFK